ncbi:YkvA family protein [Azohydromonas caseinilytica]|uniref:DUF1232 domain-containing protein n=1 Tax=Azohydromonas caseinilytica TaxID=2728836 RepID=A0A848FHI8_9BURK|nr:DUF1232 domain-containing protein [Azohydromonas caseinilytica]NML17723.1 DUF1232 domain-containing protein [Azohydromonas caseinilytica]
MGRVARLFKAARQGRLKTMLLALWKLFKHPETPLAAKLVAVAVIAYAVSPIDLVPDFIPVLGQLDDLILLPLGIALAVRLTPAPLWEARLREAEAEADKLPRMLWGAVAIVLLWLLVVAGLVRWWMSRQS